MPEQDTYLQRTATPLQKAAMRGLLWAAATNFAVQILAPICYRISIYIEFMFESANKLALIICLPLLLISISFIMSERRLAIIGIVLALLGALIPLIIACMPQSNF